MNELILYTITLDNYIVNIYYTQESLSRLDMPQDFILPIIEKLNTEEYARGIIEKLEVSTDIKKIEVFDKNNNLILESAAFGL